VADPDPRLLSALTTEHFVLQSAINATVAEAGARSTLYMMALSSSLVAVGFLAPSSAALMPFLAIVLPTLFMLGVFTVIRLIDTALEAQQYLAASRASTTTTARCRRRQRTRSRRTCSAGPRPTTSRRSGSGVSWRCSARRRP